MKIHHYISVVWATICLLAASLAACSDRDYPGGGNGGEDVGGASTFRLGIDMVLPVMPGSRATYEEGVGSYENTVNLRGKDYRILLFSEANTLIAKFNNDDIVMIENTPNVVNPTYHSYRLYAEVDKDITTHSAIKLVVLANWGDYPALKIGETTIDDLAGYAAGAVSSDEATTFMASRQFLAADGKYIPMFGVKECKNVKWNNFDLTWLGDLWLLRAVAKIEVKAAEGMPRLQSVSLTHFNSLGTCAPKKVYSEEEYLEGDYPCAPLTLPGDKNDADSPSYSILAGDDNVFTLYVPEYQNLSDPSNPRELTSDYAQLKVRFEGKPNEYFVDFKYYSDASAADNNAKKGDYFDIRRNYYYKYTLSLRDADPEVAVEVLPYRSVTLRPDFGLPLQGLTLNKTVVYLYTNLDENTDPTESYDLITAYDENGRQIDADKIKWSFAGDEKNYVCTLDVDEEGRCVVKSIPHARGRDVITATITDRNGLDLSAEVVVEVSGRHLGFDKTFLGLMPEDKSTEGSKSSFNAFIIAETDDNVKISWRLLKEDDVTESELEYLRENITVRVDGRAIANGETVGDIKEFIVEVQGGLYTGTAHLWVDVECPAANGVAGRATYSTYCEILVENPSISCYPQEAYTAVGQSTSVAAVIYPKFSDYFPQVKYTSSDESVATVDDNGLIHALKPGVTIIEVYNDTDFSERISDKMKVTVTNNPLVLVRKDYMNEIVRQVELKAGESVNLLAYSYGQDVSGSAKWTVVDKPSKLNIVKDDVSGGKVEALAQLNNNGSSIAVGTVAVQAEYTTADGTVHTQKCIIVVAQNRQLIVDEHPFAISADAEVPFSAHFFPDKRPLALRNDVFTWKSNNTSVLAFSSSNGANYAVAKNNGLATVTATADYPGDKSYSGTSQVEVIGFPDPVPPVVVFDFQLNIYDENGNFVTEIKTEDGSKVTANTSTGEVWDNNGVLLDYINLPKGKTYTAKAECSPKNPTISVDSWSVYKRFTYHTPDGLTYINGAKDRIVLQASDDGVCKIVSNISPSPAEGAGSKTRFAEVAFNFTYNGTKYSRRFKVYSPD